MGGVIAILVFLVRMIITIHIKALFFLIKHFDITNGIIVGLFVQVFTRDFKINVWIRLSMLMMIVVVCILMQHFFKPTRILFGVISSFFAGLMAYGIFQESRINPWISFAIAFIISGILNGFSWIRMDSKKEKQGEPE